MFSLHLSSHHAPRYRAHSHAGGYFPGLPTSELVFQRSLSRQIAHPKKKKMSRADDDRFDSMYLSLAQQNQGIDNLFESFFGFLRRKTDYYTGASEVALEEKVLQVRELACYSWICNR